jgi:hypothetical protein
MDNNQLDKYKTFQEWFEANLSESAADIASHGADAGFPNISYVRDCVELFDHFEEEVWNMAVEDAEELGCKNVAAMISDFNRSDMLNSFDTFTRCSSF